MFEMFSTDLVIRLCLAALLGGILGLERERHGRPAGLRTHLLVSLGASAFMILSPLVASMGQGLPRDPGRIAAQIVSGIGFLGAGAIVKEGVTISRSNHGCLSLDRCCNRYDSGGWILHGSNIDLGSCDFRISFTATLRITFKKAFVSGT